LRSASSLATDVLGFFAVTDLRTAADQETLEFVEINIDLGFTLLEAARLSKEAGRSAHARQVIARAGTVPAGVGKALESIHHATPASIEGLKRRLRNLEFALAQFQN
jgi:hypothetical protein